MTESKTTLEIELARAISVLKDQPDTVKSILMNTTAFNDMAEKHCIYKADEPSRNAMMDITIVTNKFIPEHLAVLEHASGKKVVLNLIDRKTAELPSMEKPEIIFPEQERYWYGIPTRT